MTRIEKLDQELKAIAPVFGVSIGRWEDRGTWRIDFAPSASPEQRAAARSVLEGFDPDAPVIEPAEQPINAEELLAALEKKGLVTREEVLAEKDGPGAIPA